MYEYVERAPKHSPKLTWINLEIVVYGPIFGISFATCYLFDLIYSFERLCSRYEIGIGRVFFSYLRQYFPTDFSTDWQFHQRQRVIYTETL